MLELNAPLQLSPIFKPKIWGRKDLAPLFAGKGKAAAKSAPGSVSPDNTEGNDGPIGEVWITDEASTFLNGPVAGLTLGEVSRKHGPELHGSSWQDHRFPLLAKYIFTRDWLSVQVHPDDAYAATHDPGNLGKCEMWYIVKADRKAEILLGLKSRFDEQRLKVAFEKAASKELLNRFRPKVGEAVYVPPGTVHALGPGLVIFEVEQNSDLTYRLDDFGRVGLDGKPRPLHLDKGLEVICAELTPQRNLPRLEFREPYGSRRYVLACRHFALEELTLRKSATFEGQRDRVEVLSALSGAGRVETAAGWLGYRCGDTWLIPPANVQYRLVPVQKTRWLKFYVPDIEKDFRRPLARRGVRATKIKKVVFD